jgi:hypothetical protein
MAIAMSETAGLGLKNPWHFSDLLRVHSNHCLGLLDMLHYLGRTMDALNSEAWEGSGVGIPWTDR